MLTSTVEQSLPRSRLLTIIDRYGLLFLALTVFAVLPALAGGDGTEFDAIVEMLAGWLEGGLGKLLALAAFAVGMGIGIVKQSVIAIVIGLTFALVLSFGPALIQGILTYTL